MVEGNGGDEVILSHARQLLIDEDGLATPSPAHQHDGTTIGHQQVQEVAETNGLRCVNQHRLCIIA